MNNKPTFIFFIFFFYLFEVFGQIKPSAPTILSPNASSFSIYGEVPVSHYTGLPDITVPLYEISVKNLKIPISLRYHAGGVKPVQHSGWVGNGWNLTAGGTITRTIRKFPDERKDVNSEFGYYYNAAVLNPTNWYRHAEGSSYTDPTQKHIFHESLTRTDLEADEFSFNFLNYSGKFYYDQETSSFKVQSDSPLKIYLDPSEKFVDPFIKPYYPGQGMSHSFSKFIIEDDLGNKFIFGGSSAIEYSEPILPTNQGVNLWSNAWHLVKIITANDASIIDFQYERGPFISQLQRYTQQYLIQSNDCFALNPYPSLPIDGSFISPVYLKRIEVSNGPVIDFITSATNELRFSNLDYPSTPGQGLHDYAILEGYFPIPYFNTVAAPSPNLLDRLIWFKLDTIHIRNNNMDIIRTIDLSYNNIPEERLFLENVSFRSSNNSQMYNYSFSYFDKERLPPYLGNMNDHWGFTNHFNYQSFDANSIFLFKQPSFDEGLLGILDTIYYPTGGKTAFEYENHTYSSVVSSTNRTLLNPNVGIAGGMRIKKITSYHESNSIASVKEYKYLKNYINGGDIPSGVMNYLPVYTSGPHNMVDMANQPFTLFMFKSTPLLPLNDNNGIHVGYSEVTEVQKGLTGTQKAYSVFTYSNHDNGFKDSEPVWLYKRDNIPFNQYNSRHYERGRLLKTEFYNDLKQSIKKIENKWSRLYETASSTIRSIDFSFINVAMACNTIRYFPSSAAYLNYTYPFALTKKTETEYVYLNGLDSVVQEVVYTYDDRQLLRKEVTRTSDLDSLTKQYYYPVDSSAIPPYNAMVLRNMVNYPLRTDSYKNNQLLHQEFIQYSGWQNLSKIYSVSYKEKKKDGQLREVIKFKNYDDYGNIIEIDEKGKASSYLWDYNGQYPIAEVKNAVQADVAYAGFEADGKGNWSYAGNTVMDNTSPTGRRRYTLTSGQMSKAGLSAGRKYILEYWIKGSTHPVVAGGTVSASVLLRSRNGWSHYRRTLEGTTSAILSGSAIVDDVRLYPVDAQMTTYTYDPLVGMSSETDASGRSVYYEYDGALRLKSIKDQDGNILKNHIYHYKP